MLHESRIWPVPVKSVGLFDRPLHDSAVLRSNGTVKKLLPESSQALPDQCSHIVPLRKSESVKVRQRSDKDVGTTLGVDGASTASCCTKYPT
jgi:hypothetical protein